MNRLAAILLCFMCLASFGQADSAASQDSARAARKKIYSAPRRASILSAILPGAGQVYNRKYWKVPLIYAGLGGLGYMFYVNHDNFSFYSRNLAALHDGDDNTTNVTPYDEEGLIELKRGYRRYRDYAGLGIALLYVINIVDANVDAHLKTFDISDDLGLQVSPQLFTHHTSIAAGINLRLKFH